MSSARHTIESSHSPSVTRTTCKPSHSLNEAAALRSRFFSSMRSPATPTLGVALGSWGWCEIARFVLVCGSGFGEDVADVDGFGALRAYDDGVGVVVAGGVMQHEGCSFGAGHPAVAPGCHGCEDREDFASFLCEAVFAA